MKDVVVGGGIAGILAAIILSEKGREVLLIEKAKSLGGLLKSRKIGDAYFDYGTHVPMDTGISDLDNMLFGEINSNDWNVMDILKPCNFMNGKMYKESQLIYLPYLDEEVYRHGLVEMLNLDEFDEDSCSNSKEYLDKKFGKILTENLFRPLIKKLMSEDLESLHPKVHFLFGYNRLIPGSSHFSREIKKSEFYDEKLAFASFWEGISSKKNYYPKSGGVGNWVEILTKKAVRNGVRILNSESISKLDIENKNVKSIRLANSGEEIQINSLIWTIPTGILHSLVNFKTETSIPKIQKMNLFHFIFDKPFETDNYFIYCNDPDMYSFRITLYPQLQQRKNESPYNLTIEVMGENEVGDTDMEDVLVRELHKMNVLSEGTRVVHFEREDVQFGFPVYTNEYVNAQASLNNEAESVLDNVVFVGKAGTDTFFMHDVLRTVYEKFTGE